MVAEVSVGAPVGPAPRGRAGRWLARRIPRRGRVRLDQRSIFIFPPAAGFAFTALLLVLLLTAINYQNALVFALAFLLGSLFTAAIGHTYRNLAGLELAGVGAAPVFAGEHAEFRLRVRGSARGHRALRLGWPGELPVELSVPPSGEVTVCLPFATAARGWCVPGRLRVETRWPLGLLRAWSWVDLDLRALVHPRPLPGAVPAREGVADGEGSGVAGRGDDFLGLREFRDGDPLKHVAWKAWARGGELRVKTFGGRVDRRHWLELDALPGLDLETRLGRLCARALELERAGEPYGLRLGATALAPATGEAHRAEVLRALALFGRDREAAS